MSSQIAKHSPISDMHIGAWVDGRWEGEGLLQMANGSSYQGVRVCVRERERGGGERGRETVCRLCINVCPRAVEYVRGDFRVCLCGGVNSRAQLTKRK